MSLKNKSFKQSLILWAFVVFIASATGVFATFFKTNLDGTPPTDKGYGYGYGIETDTNEYGYGYGYGLEDEEVEKPRRRHGGWGSSIRKDRCSGADTSGSYYDDKCSKDGEPEVDARDEVEIAEKAKDTIEKFLETPAGKTAEESLKGSNYSTEWQMAYIFARAHGITTMPTIYDARMNDRLTRAELAKMMSNYAVNTLGEKADTTKKCVFNDVAGQSKSLRDAMVSACQLDIMGINPDTTPLKNFMPSKHVTRAEFATVLSRLYFGDKYESNDTVKYYENHLKALKNKDILKNDTPTLKEIRGYIMIMLMRISQ